MEMHHMRQWLGFLSVALFSGPVFAHPGHGVIPADSPWHYAIEPVHAVWPLLILAFIGGVFLVRRQLRQSRQRAVAARQHQEQQSQSPR
jgi:hypothetical protein